MCIVCCPYYNMKNDRSQEGKILKDTNSKGKIRDWRGKKMASLKLSRSYERISENIKPEYESRGVHIRYRQMTRRNKNEKGEVTGKSIGEEPMGLYDKDGKRVVNYEKRADNMKFCGSYLEFADIQDKLKLTDANFCRVPLCPMCQWRKAMRTFFDTSRIMQLTEERCPNYVPVFLTLTIRNCSIEDLRKNLDNIFEGWHDFMRSKTLNPLVKGERKHIIKGWFRALEITYNDKMNTFHPHFHAIMFVDKSYFKGKYYMKTEDWVRLWRKSAKLDYDPVCDIRRTRTSKGSRKEVAEVAKYMYKDAEILNKRLSDDKKDDVVKSLSNAIHGRRLYAYGGVMKEIAAELKIKEVDKADLINTSDENEVNPSLAKMILTYKWNMGVSNYTLSKKIELAEGREGSKNA